MMKITAMIFDMDGTLVDSERVHWQAWKQTLGTHGITVPGYTEFKKYVGVSDEQMALEFSEAADSELDPDKLVSRKCQTYLELIPRIKLLPGVVDLLDRWHHRCSMAVASSSPHRELVALLDHHGLNDRFLHVIGGDMVTRKKPDPEIYVMAVNRLGVPPSSCIAFEDSQSGVASAKSAGLTAVAIPQPMSADHDFSRADLVLESLADFDEHLLKQLSTV